MSVKNQATTSVFWSAVERFSVQGIQFLLSIILARILVPSDFGLIAMMSFFIAIAQTFVDSGFANALIQKKDRTEADYCTVFYFNIVLSVVLYLILFACASPIASFYNEPTLTNIVKVVGLSLIVNSLGLVQHARLTIALDFKRQAMASLTAVIVSGAIAIYMAYNGYGVWTLVIQSLLNNLVRNALLWRISQWRPKPIFSKKSFKTLFAFGSKLLASTLLHTIYQNLYTLIIGKKFASAELGYFNRASTFAQFPSTNLTNIIVRAVYPIQCRLQNDDAQLFPLFLKYLRMACYLIFPIMISLCVLADPLIRIVLTDKWLPAVPLMQILSIAYMWDPVMKINHNMLNVKGRSDYFLMAEVWKKIIAFAILFATIPFGVSVMCIGLIGYALADMLIITYYTKKITGIGIGKQIRELTPIVLLTLATAGTMSLALLLSTSPWLQLTAGVSFGAITYIGISKLFKFNELSILLSFIKGSHKNKSI